MAEDPLSASPSPRETSEPEANPVSGGAGRRTVLLVEDNPTDVFVIREVVEQCELDLNLHVANDGQDALQYLQTLEKTEESGCPVLILLDLNIPKLSGIEILRRLRSNSRCNRAPVIVITSSTAEADRIAVQRLGAEAYFQKPTSLRAYMELAKLIKELILR